MRVAGIVVATGGAFGLPADLHTRVAGGRPLAWWGAELLAPACESIAVLAPEAAMPAVRAQLKGVAQACVLPTQASRWQSVRFAIAELGPSELVVIHDYFRPLASSSLLRQVLTESSSSGAAAPAIDLTETVAEVDELGRAVRYGPPRRLRVLQTPQAFVTGLLQDSLFALAQRPPSEPPLDDAAVVGAAGGLVQLVPGEHSNRQLLTSQDFATAEPLFSARGAGADAR